MEKSARFCEHLVRLIGNIDMRLICSYEASINMKEIIFSKHTFEIGRKEIVYTILMPNRVENRCEN